MARPDAILDATVAQRVQNLEFVRIQEFHDCYVKNFLPSDNMRQILTVGEDFANVNQL